MGNVDLFGVADDDVAVVAEGDGAGPERADSSAFILEEGRDMVQTLEVVACPSVSLGPRAARADVVLGGAASERSMMLT